MATDPQPVSPAFDAEFSCRIRADFPILSDRSLVYLDTAASAQKPAAVLDRMRRFHEAEYANIHRGVYKLSQDATEEFEGVRRKLVRFLGAKSEREVVFTHGTTEAINLVAYSWGGANLKPGDEIILSVLEHHANFVPWQLAAERTGAVLRFVGLTAEGLYDIEHFERLLTKRTKLVAVTQLSNALGVAPPLSQIVERAHAAGARVLVDGAQGACHFPLRGAQTGADFYAFSGHKLYGPTGIGVLYGRDELLSAMPPFMSGGDMIRSVSVNGTTFAEPPARFEPGTPHIAGVLGLGAALDYLEGLGWEKLFALEHALVSELEAMLETLSDFTVRGPKGSHTGLVTFTSEAVHPHDLSQYLSEAGIAVRAGHHCAMPLIEHLGRGASTRASMGIYNTPDDIKALKTALIGAVEFFTSRRK